MIKAVLKTVGALLVLGVLAVGGVYLYYFVILPPNIPATDLDVEITPARVTRGEYLANAVFGCMYCHSERDWELFGAPPKPGTLGKGGEVFDQRVGISGVLISPNITPTGIGDWTDGEVYRAVVNGLHPDGYAYFPIMPFDVYLHLETEDVYSIIAYLRTLDPLPGEYRGRRLTPLMEFIANSRVLPADPWDVDHSDPVSRGEYITIIAGCRFCHTPANERMQPYENMRFGGGLGMIANGRKVYSANISADPETGIGSWSVDDFVARFRAYENVVIPVSEIGYQTQHAWTEYAKLTDTDLADIYAYIMAQPPVRNEVNLLGN
ncbi:MAG: cytochrome C [Gammaproteobacteria bacterium]|nr:cytochrome C [Gammaproteobacteria bacterium]